MNACVVALLVLTLQAPPAGPHEIADNQPHSRHPTNHLLANTLEWATRRVLDGIENQVDWDEQNAYALAAIERLYELQGWNSEHDLFTLDVYREMSTLRPWQVSEQFDVLAGRCADRYMLDDTQTQILHDLLVRETCTLFVRHAGELLPLMAEVAHTRLNGQPFTTEQVTEWTHVLDPIFYDGRERVSAIAAELLEVFDPQQQELLLADLDETNRRLDRIQELGRLWWHGDWEPADWGLDQDPVQLGEHRGALRPHSTAPPAEPADRDEHSFAADSVAPRRNKTLAPNTDHPLTSQPAKARPDELDAWTQFVRDFIARYHLDEAQQQRAWIIHRTTCERRDLLEERFARRRTQLSQAASPSAGEAFVTRQSELEQSHAATRDLLFEAMKRRLERLPTRAQRRDATEPPASRPARPEYPRPVPADLSGP